MAVVVTIHVREGSVLNHTATDERGKELMQCTTKAPDAYCLCGMYRILWSCNLLNYHRRGCGCGAPQ